MKSQQRLKTGSTPSEVRPSWRLLTRLCCSSACSPLTFSGKISHRNVMNLKYWRHRLGNFNSSSDISYDKTKNLLKEEIQGQSIRDAIHAISRNISDELVTLDT